ncbi:LacI family DNA-binding transcriptional regulator [Sphingobacterium litopenaei]|uniref:LacI family DNA-binding transcriptional regulator n=1 Tax=Sphingobacterium litopenaei TaxID=2763500 RepID=A0ABR7YBS6_9SPHI|nr:LacI family DNA-binding transcriptional regulator [Sphingobacterium litopenaei]MBD1428756.1 LacI family DNA-binding transcriptional regulator [Sphingobacterium litopenaei]
MKKSDSRRLTIKDLAKELNLSSSTISRVLSNNPRISEATKKLVNDKVKELGFSLDPIASSFRSKKTKSIGVVAPRIDVDFHSKVISGIEDYASELGYQITIFQSKDSYIKEKEILKLLETSLAAGIIICPSLETQKVDHLKKVIKSNIPLVLYDRPIENLDTNIVCINDYQASYDATKHLINTGCKRIAHISGNLNVNIFNKRFEGYKAALVDNDLEFEDALLYQTHNLSYQEGLVAAEKLSKLKNPIDGIVCANDYTASAAVQLFKKLNISIPENISIIGFSNYPISTIIEPNISTIDDNAYYMGNIAAKILIQQIEDKFQKKIDHQEILVKTDLIIRDSTKKVKK